MLSIRRGKKTLHFGPSLVRTGVSLRNVQGSKKNNGKQRKLRVARTTFSARSRGVKCGVFVDFKFEWPTIRVRWHARLPSCFVALEIWRAEPHNISGNYWVVATQT